jgi:hypothetical protein
MSSSRNMCLCSYFPDLQIPKAVLVRLVLDDLELVGLSDYLSQRAASSRQCRNILGDT